MHLLSLNCVFSICCLSWRVRVIAVLWKMCFQIHIVFWISCNCLSTEPCHPFWAPISNYKVIYSITLCTILKWSFWLIALIVWLQKISFTNVCFESISDKTSLWHFIYRGHLQIWDEHVCAMVICLLPAWSSKSADPFYVTAITTANFNENIIW
jgi:hypothetical protein